MTASASQTGSPGRLAGLKRVPGVELFASGTRGGRDYTPADIDELASNAQRFGHLIRPPLKIGHGERQMIAAGLTDPQERAAEATGIPRFGGLDWRTVNANWASCPVCQGRGRVEGERCPECKGQGRLRMLRGDFHQVDPRLARLIKGRNYDRVSVEIYPRDKAPEGLPKNTLHLRAVSLEGGDLPVVKSLAEIPDPVDEHEAPRTATLRYSESRELDDGVWVCFSEVRRMPLHEGTSNATRSQNIAEMIRAGHDPKQAAAAAYRQQRAAEGHAAHKHGEHEPMRHEHIRKLAEAGFDQRVLDEMPDHHLEHMAEIMGHGHRMAEPMPDYDDTAEPPDAPQDQATQYAEKARRLHKYAERCLKKYAEGTPSPSSTMTNPDKVAEAKFSETLTHVQEQLNAIRGQTKRQFIEGEIRKYSEQGRVYPSELDAGPSGNLPTLVDDLCKLDDSAKVHKFSEGGKTVSLSELDLALRRIGSRPVQRLGERIRGGGTTGQSDSEKTKVENHWESFSEDFQALGTPKEDFVKAFEAQRKLDPKLTADRFLNVRRQ